MGTSTQGHKINWCSRFELFAYIFSVLLLIQTGLVLVTKSFCEKSLMLFLVKLPLVKYPGFNLKCFILDIGVRMT